MHSLSDTFVRFVVVASLTTWTATLHAAEPHSTAPKKRSHATAKSESASRGKASYYAHHFAGKQTASGERYDPDAMTAAHRTLPLGTQLKVTNPKTDRSVVVTVNDRGPMRKDRVVDLSGAAAKELGMTKAGTAQVETEVVGRKTMRPDDAAR